MRICTFFLILTTGVLTLCSTACAQSPVRGSGQQGAAVAGQVIDAQSSQPITGVTIQYSHTSCCNESKASCSCLSDHQGFFRIKDACACPDQHQPHSQTLKGLQPGDSLSFKAVGYSSATVLADTGYLIVKLHPKDHFLHQVLVTASRFHQNRSDIPAAVSVIDSTTIEDTKATQLDQLVNKTPGVFMVDLGNEQHEMSIRQPMTTKSLFLYLEDGMPIRTSGLYNHNSLLEMNMAAMDRIEILKGPASAQYGPEAVGGAINIITAAPPETLKGKFQVQADNNGYKRTDLRIGNTFGKLAMDLSGYYANRHNGPIDYSDFHKTAITLNTIYTFNQRLHWKNKATYVDYYADMSGSLDSAQFANKDFSSHYRLTYRKVKAFRYTSSLEQSWNRHSDTKLAFMYRDNQTGQNPSYRVKDIKDQPSMATGEINLNSFKSYVGLLQQRQMFDWWQSQLIAGLSADISPSDYHANFIEIQKNKQGDYASYTNADSLLTKYSTGINNMAAFVQWQMTPVKGFKITLAGRYDRFAYHFKNALASSANTGAPSSDVHFNHWTPKAGIAYHHGNIGFYSNYAQGYVPPQVTELFNNVKVPFLEPQVFDSYEIGGWVSLANHRLYLDWSLYNMEGKGEIISVRNDDGSFENKNAGKTRHTGLEYGLHYQPVSSWAFTLSGTWAKHSFLKESQKGQNLDGNLMSNAPHFLNNASLTFKPSSLPGLRASLECQSLSSYYMDDANTTKYEGFTVFNIRTGYNWQHLGVWVNALNILDRYYADIATKSAYGYSYNLANPFTISIGVQYQF